MYVVGVKPLQNEFVNFTTSRYHKSIPTRKFLNFDPTLGTRKWKILCFMTYEPNIETYCHFEFYQL